MIKSDGNDHSYVAIRKIVANFFALVSFLHRWNNTTFFHHFLCRQFTRYAYDLQWYKILCRFRARYGKNEQKKPLSQFHKLKDVFNSATFRLTIRMRSGEKKPHHAQTERVFSWKHTYTHVRTYADKSQFNLHSIVSFVAFYRYFYCL